jgi:Ca2+-binding RTX toxin-like protein
MLENPSGAPLDFGGVIDRALLIGNDTIDARYRVNDAIVNDKLHGQNGDDLIMSGSGNDFVSGGSGADRVYGGTGNDKLIGGDFFLNVEAVGGQDTLRGEDGDDVAMGGQGNDALIGGAGTDTAVYGGTFASLSIVKTATGFRVASLLDGTDALQGIERIATDDGTYAYSHATNSWIRLNGSTGVNQLRPESVKWGTAGDDTIADLADAKKNIVYGLGGNDTINLAYTYGIKIAFGGAGDDTITADIGGNFGAARLYGEAGNDTLSGTVESDFLSGGDGDDTIDGGFAGFDFIFGGAGADRITGGECDDTLSGGLGADIFNFVVTQSPQGSTIHERGWRHDVITDFQLGVDRLNIVTGINDPVLTDTAEGLLVTVQLQLAFPSDGADATILLKGVHGPGVTLEDLLI